jgi:hypothetical protein
MRWVRIVMTSIKITLNMNDGRKEKEVGKKTDWHLYGTISVKTTIM